MKGELLRLGYNLLGTIMTGGKLEKLNFTNEQYHRHRKPYRCWPGSNG